MSRSNARYGGERPTTLGLGRTIRRLRLRRGQTQEELSELAGIHYTFLGAIEREQRLPSLQTLARIAGALQVRLPELFKT